MDKYSAHVKPGDLVYVDAFRSGLLPAKYVGLGETMPTVNGAGIQGVTVKLTADRPGYSRGEVLVKHPNSVIPRGLVYTRGGRYRINAGLHGWAFMVTTPEGPRIGETSN